jgi:uncharacterized membrane protein YidH (DUF202 family)
VGVPTLVAWHRTGLVLAVIALACLVAFVLYLLLGGSRDSAWALLGLGAFVCGLIGLGFLRRTWEDPEVRDDAQVVRARRLSSVAMTSYGAALIPNAIYAVYAVQSDPSETMNWLGVVSAVLGAVVVVCFIAMLTVATGWSPSRR